MRTMIKTTAIALAFSAATIATASAQISVGAGASGSTGARVGTASNSSGLGVNNNTGLGLGVNTNRAAGSTNINTDLDNRAGIRSGTTLPPRDTTARTGTAVDASTNANVNTSGVVNSTTRTVQRTSDGVMRSVTDTIESPLGRTGGVSVNNRAATGTNISAGSSNVR